MATAWGETGPASEGDGEHIHAGAFPLGDGHSMTINGAVARKLLHDPDAVAGITHRATTVAAAANNMVALDPDTVARLSETQQGPAYTITVTNDPGHTRARAYISTNGELGRLDQAHNLTLLKAMDTSPSDPKPHGHHGTEGE